MLGVLDSTPSVINIIWLPGAAHRPDGDVIFADVAREDASVVIADLKRLEIHEEGSISIELDRHARSPTWPTRPRSTRRGAPADAVVWEEVEPRTSRVVELSAVFLPSWSWRR